MPRLTTANSFVAVIDIQDKLLAAIPDAVRLIRNAGFVLDVANLLSIPVQATEQYPKGLGPTSAEIARRLPSSIPPKTAFSAWGCDEFRAACQAAGRTNAVVIGMETHVCIAQTTVDLLEAGYNVFLPVDALAARFAIDHETALRRLERSGAVPTTSEAVAFEWIRDAAQPQFKAVSKLVRERSVNT